MEQRIPEEWRVAVLKVLAKGISSPDLRITNRARQDFEDLFPSQFPYELADAVGKAIKNPSLPVKRIKGMEPPGDIYAFFFDHAQKRLYGKVGLHEDGTVVIIFSAHRPLKGEEL